MFSWFFFFLYCGLVWFSSVGKIKAINWTKPCGWVKRWSKYIQTKCSFMQFWFGLDRFAVFLLVWFWTPLKWVVWRVNFWSEITLLNCFFFLFLWMLYLLSSSCGVCFVLLWFLFDIYWHINFDLMQIQSIILLSQCYKSKDMCIPNT